MGSAKLPAGPVQAPRKANYQLVKTIQFANLNDNLQKCHPSQNG